MDDLPADMIINIIREERVGTLLRLATLDVPPAWAGEDLLSYYGSLQTAIHQTMADRVRVLETRTSPLALRLVADELNRVATRIEVLGLWAGSPERH